MIIGILTKKTKIEQSPKKSEKNKLKETSKGHLPPPRRRKVIYVLIRNVSRNRAAIEVNNQTIKKNQKHQWKTKTLNPGPLRSHSTFRRLTRIKHPLTGLLWERHFGEVLMELRWERVQNWECLSVHRKQGLFLSVYVDDIKVAGKK